jgi:hypothetical protein
LTAKRVVLCLVGAWATAALLELGAVAGILLLVGAEVA